MTLPDHGDQTLARSKREVIALVLRDWIHETPMSQCNTSVDICLDWPLAFEVAHRVLVAMDQREDDIRLASQTRGECMTDRDMIERKCRSQGWTIDEWREDEDGLLAVVGRAIATEDDDEAGIYSNDEGEMTVSVVGTAKYSNRRIHVGLLTEYHDAPCEVRDPSILERI